jgi:predicted metal-dependent enzyme (double-stranded beta helix superfamily)
MLMYKPVGLLGGILAGAIAGVLFKQVWRLAAGEPEAPHATDQSRRWAEVLAAAALQGAIFAIVKAAVDRAGASAVKELTGRWPE